MTELSNNPDAGEIKETSLWSGLLFLAAAWRCLSETDCLCTRRALIGLLWDCSGDEGQRVPFDWGLFYSQPPAVAPTVSNNHWCTSHPLSLVVFIQYFKWIALQKSTQAQAITCGHKERCSWKLLHWLRQKKPHTCLWSIYKTSHLFVDLLSQEAYIADLDAKSGASLKLTLLNPRGRIWTMVAGGGASVVYR